MRVRKEVSSFKDKFQLLSCAFNESWNQIVFGGIENVLKIFDLRKNEVSLDMIGHFDSITGLAVSPDASHVLSNSMDRTLCVWDIRPFSTSKDRCVKTFHGHQHNFEKNLLRCSWSPDSKVISAGSSDRHVYIWDAIDKRILYKLPGHNGSVNEVVFHPTEPIILSCSSDKTLYLGEIDYLS
jgi:Prp8 binding protein